MAAGSQFTTTVPLRSKVPLFDGMNKIPGGLMLIPLILGSIVGTFAPGFLELGNFTTALFRDSALPLIGVLIYATGMQITLRTSGPVLATSAVLLLCKSIIPATVVVLIGTLVGIEGILGVSILALLVSMDNSNGGIWLAFTGRYGRERDRGAYIASAVNDGPFFSLLFLGAAGLAEIPVTLLLAAVIPLLLGVVAGNLDARWTEVMRPVPNIVIPFFAFALGTGINLGNVVTGGLSGILVGLVAVLFTGTTAYFGFRWLLRRGKESGMGIASATTAGNAIATPAIVGAADPTFAPFVEVATAQVASAVLVSAVLAPLLAAFVLKRQGGLREVPVAGLDDAPGDKAVDDAAVDESPADAAAVGVASDASAANAPVAHADTAATASTSAASTPATSTPAASTPAASSPAASTPAASSPAASSPGAPPPAASPNAPDDARRRDLRRDEDRRGDDA